MALLGTMIVAPAHRGAGIAREALALLEGSLASGGIRWLRSGVGAGDTRAHTILRALGFEEMNERRHVSLDRGRIMLALFEKEIGAAG